MLRKIRNGMEYVSWAYIAALAIKGLFDILYDTVELTKSKLTKK